MAKEDFDKKLEEVIEKDPRYPKEAYYFVREALAFTQKKLGRLDESGDERHVTGQELLEGIREYALSEFGPMTLTVFDEWGIRRCEDFGEIVFNLVDAELLGKTENDSKDDFKGGYDFEEAFRKPFLPSSKLSKN